jgi:hypothetical protein
VKQGQPSPRRLIAKFYRCADGSEPVNEFIELQQPAAQLAIDRQIERINLHRRLRATFSISA